MSRYPFNHDHGNDECLADPDTCAHRMTSYFHVTGYTRCELCLDGWGAAEYLEMRAAQAAPLETLPYEAEIDADDDRRMGDL